MLKLPLTAMPGYRGTVKIGPHIKPKLPNH